MKSCKFFLAALVMCALTAPINASYYTEPERDCASRCYECGCNPLNECSWGLQVAAGVRPTLWNHRGAFSTINCLIDEGLVNIGTLPKFNNLYKMPWQVGLQLSFATSCNTNVFGEFNFARSNFKCCDSVFIGESNLRLNFSKYKIYEGYVGGRFYFDRWCDRVAFFLGAKVGALHHEKIRTGSFTGITESSLISDCCVDDAGFLYDFCAKHTSVAGGAHVGFDICLLGNLSFVITAEVVANCGCGCGDVFTLNSIDSAFLNGSTLLTPGVHTELAFPITFGFKFNF